MSSSGSLGSPDSPWSSNSPASVSTGPATAGVASLDSSLVQQTKSEIRTLAAEVAELAHSGVSVDEFYDGFLPRICVAMGASASAVWLLHERELSLEASHTLPADLFDESESGQCNPTPAHLSILECAIADGQPVLVPPKSVTVEVDRPTNPIQESLIIVPVRVEEEIEYVVEIVQKPSGGPAAQRGYLRFVAQMADLLADYFRRKKLSDFAEQAETLELLESSLLDVSQQTSFTQTAQVAAEALNELAEAEITVLIEKRGRRIQTLAVSDADAPDPRSEITLLISELTRELNRQHRDVCKAPLWLAATERRGADARGGADANKKQEGYESFQIEFDKLCEILHCRSAAVISFDDSASTLGWLFFSGASKVHRQEEGRESVSRFGKSIGSLLVAARPQPNVWQSWLPFQTHPGQLASKRHQIQKWISRVALIGLAVIIAGFPLPQQISATATLIPVEKVPYYAPYDGVVREVLVNEGDSVQKGRVLLQLVSHELSTQYDALIGELRLNEDRQEQLEDLLNRGTELSQIERNQLEGDLQLLQIQSQTKQQDRQVINKQLQELRIDAIAEGVVATWNLSNRLLNRPVVAGDLLVTTYVPEGRWKLQLAIPDYRVGIVASRLSALEGEGQGIPVSFSLSSHPDQLQKAALIRLGSHTIRSTAEGAGNEKSVVLGEAMLDVKKLPLAKDGAIARATIDCGKVPAIWLMVRDAYWAISSRVQMIW